MGRKTKRGRESSGKIVTETERKKAEDATLETWFIPYPFSCHSELNLFPILPDPHSCSAVAHFMHKLQLSSLPHLHRLTATHRKILQTSTQGACWSKRGA